MRRMIFRCVFWEAAYKLDFIGSRSGRSHGLPFEDILPLRSRRCVDVRCKLHTRIYPGLYIMRVSHYGALQPRRVC